MSVTLHPTYMLRSTYLHFYAGIALRLSLVLHPAADSICLSNGSVRLQSVSRISFAVSGVSRDPNITTMHAIPGPIPYDGKPPLQLYVRGGSRHYGSTLEGMNRQRGYHKSATEPGFTHGEVLGRRRILRKRPEVWGMIFDFPGHSVDTMVCISLL